MELESPRADVGADAPATPDAQALHAPSVDDAVDAPLPDAPPEEAPLVPLHLAAREEAAPKRKAGRPRGAKDAKPRAKRAPTAVKAVPITADSAPLAPELERVLPGSRPVPEDPDHMIFKLLKQQAQNRRSSKVDLWKSWFR